MSQLLDDDDGDDDDDDMVFVNTINLEIGTIELVAAMRHSVEV